MFSFNDTRIPTSLKKALAQLRFETPTPIQEKAIPQVLTGRDLIACAQTGTGKTAAFCIPTLIHLSLNPTHTALFLVPTRELAQQVHQVWCDLTRFTPRMQSVLVIGGASMFRQINDLARKPRVVIATPGRLIDHLEKRTFNISETAVVVLDEADRMLDMGFAPQLAKIARVLPVKRQTLLFSATWNSEVDGVSKKYLKNPTYVNIGTPSTAAPSIVQEVLKTTMARKNETLLSQLKLRSGSILVFARTKSRTDRLTRFVQAAGVPVKRIHGGRSQGQRNEALAAFKSGKTRVLIATDIAARGIDVANISHVINYDLPQSPEDYVHRIGRTGRAGLSGTALSFVTPEDHNQWKSIERMLTKKKSKMPGAIASPI